MECQLLSLDRHRSIEHRITIDLEPILAAKTARQAVLLPLRNNSQKVGALVLVRSRLENWAVHNKTERVT